MNDDTTDLVFLRLFKRYDRLVKFCLVGLANTAISLATYYLLVLLGAYYQIANIVSFLFGSFNGFLLSRVWVFSATGISPIVQAAKYYVVYLSALVITMVISYVVVDILNLSKFLAPPICLCFTIPYNYLLSKKWTFSHEKGKATHGDRPE